VTGYGSQVSGLRTFRYLVRHPPLPLPFGAGWSLKTRKLCPIDKLDNVRTSRIAGLVGGPGQLSFESRALRLNLSPPSLLQIQAPNSGHEKAPLAQRLAGLHFSISRMADRKTEGKGKEPEWEYESKGHLRRDTPFYGRNARAPFENRGRLKPDHRRGEDPNAVCPSDCSLQAVSANCFGT
jgi:hypothetical protein